MSEHRLGPCARGTVLPLLVPVGIAIMAGTVANWLAPVLVTRHPLLMIELNPRLRYLVLASPRLPALPFFTLTFVRLAAVDVISYLLGRRCGEAVLDWVDQRIGRGRRAWLALQRWFARAAPALVFAVPSGVVGMLAGSSGMGAWLFGGLTAGGTLVRLVAVRLLASQFRAQLATVLRFIAQNQPWLLALTLAAGALQVLVVVRRVGRPSAP